MTTDYIKDYIVNNLGCDVRHDLDTLLEAVEETSDAFDVDQEGLLKFMLANEPMTGTHSYGFHTCITAGLSVNTSNLFTNHELNTRINQRTQCGHQVCRERYYISETNNRINAIQARHGYETIHRTDRT